MSYSTKASDVVFSNSWETYPYSSGIGGAGDLHFFKRPGIWNFYEGEIPRNYVKLNVRKKLKELYPEEFPNMDTIGYAVRYILSNLGINDYISAEDRGWESSDYWATLEAVFIPKEGYETNIFPRINGVAQKILNPKKEAEINLSSNELEEARPIKKIKLDTTNQNWHHELKCPITREIMTDPVIGTDGHTYERSAIENWLKVHARSPITGEIMFIDGLRPNLSIRKIIDILNSKNS